MYYISHHGIEGQKWGVRHGPPYPLDYDAHSAPEKAALGKKYHDKNGTLTKSGYEAYNKFLEANRREKIYEETDEYLKKFGLEKDKNGDYVLKKGSISSRVTDTEEKADKNAKYVSVTDYDDEIYQSYYNMLGLKNLKEARVEKWETTRDLKVANYDKVVDVLLNKYGDMTVEESFAQYKGNKICDELVASYGKQKIGSMYINNMDYETDSLYKFDKTGMRKKDKKERSELEDRFDASMTVTNELTKKLFNKEVKTEIYKELYKQGYDAMMDAEDKLSGFAVAPLIIMNTESALKKKSSGYIH